MQPIGVRKKVVPRQLSFLLKIPVVASSPSVVARGRSNFTAGSFRPRGPRPELRAVTPAERTRAPGPRPALAQR